jgi:hypothetical protein
MPHKERKQVWVPALRCTVEETLHRVRDTRARYTFGGGKP